MRGSSLYMEGIKLVSFEQPNQWLTGHTGQRAGTRLIEEGVGVVGGDVVDH
jgi:hypothetical protein